MRIDSHAHLSTSNITSYPPAPVGGHPVDLELLADPFSVERLEAAIADEALDHAVIVQRSHIYGYDNRYVMDAARSHPQRMSAVIAVDTNSSKGRADLERWVEEGAKAVRFSAPGARSDALARDTSWFDADEARAVWRRASELGVSACIHFSLWNKDSGLASLPGVLSDFSDTVTVVDHLANCPVAKGPPDYGMQELAAIDLPNVVFKIVPINFKFLTQANLSHSRFVARAAELFGASRLMYGSDVTNSVGAHATLIEMGEHAAEELSAADADLFLGGTAARVYKVADPRTLS